MINNRYGQPFSICERFCWQSMQSTLCLSNFPIALFITGVGLDLLSHGNCDSQFAAAYLNLSIAAAVLPAVLTDLLARQFTLEGKKLKGLLPEHVMAASLAALLVRCPRYLSDDGAASKLVKDRTRDVALVSATSESEASQGVS